jgi:hypothetical protein
MKKKAFTQVSSRILMALLAVVMVFTFAASSLGTTVSADGGVFKKNDSIYTDYKSYLDGSVVQALPSTVDKNETISVIVKLDTPSLLETYNETDKTMQVLKKVVEENANMMAELLLLANIPNAKKEEIYARHLSAVNAIAEAEKSEVAEDDGKET